MFTTLITTGLLLAAAPAAGAVTDPGIDQITDQASLICLMVDDNNVSADTILLGADELVAAYTQGTPLSPQAEAYLSGLLYGCALGLGQ